MGGDGHAKRTRSRAKSRYKVPPPPALESHPKFLSFFYMYFCVCKHFPNEFVIRFSGRLCHGVSGLRCISITSQNVTMDRYSGFDPVNRLVNVDRLGIPISLSRIPVLNGCSIQLIRTDDVKDDRDSKRRKTTTTGRGHSHAIR